ncbi:MAG: hypothetical protein JJU00_12000 [Opitutales bacterium]|nr:hypothetical protein [Opitutales bacterium]
MKRPLALRDNMVCSEHVSFAVAVSRCGDHSRENVNVKKRGCCPFYKAKTEAFRRHGRELSRTVKTVLSIPSYTAENSGLARIRRLPGKCKFTGFLKGRKDSLRVSSEPVGKTLRRHTKRPPEEASGGMEKWSAFRRRPDAMQGRSTPGPLFVAVGPRTFAAFVLSDLAAAFLAKVSHKSMK